MYHPTMAIIAHNRVVYKVFCEIDIILTIQNIMF